MKLTSLESSGSLSSYIMAHLLIGSHWGQRGIYPVGILWVHCGFWNNFPSKYPLGKWWVLLKSTTPIPSGYCQGYSAPRCSQDCCVLNRTCHLYLSGLPIPNYRIYECKVDSLEPEGNLMRSYGSYQCKLMWMEMKDIVGAEEQYWNWVEERKLIAEGSLQDNHSKHLGLQGSSLGARRYITSGYIVISLWFFTQFIQPEISGYILSFFRVYSPLWSQCRQQIHTDHFYKENTKATSGHFLNENSGFFHNYD